MQIISILFNNALEACHEHPDPKVIVKTEINKQGFFLSINDNGSGISNEMKSHLFSPTLSAKPSGLGVGLYIAKHLIEAQFNGSIKLNSNEALLNGAEFTIFIPIKNN